MAQTLRFVEHEKYTEDDYFAFDESSLGRWEFVNGHIWQMAGGSEDHNTIALNLYYALRNTLGTSGCRAFVADVKVRTGDGSHLFPDVFVVCGQRQHYQNRMDIITNPVLIVEVLSPSTAGYDRGEKFDHYATIPTLTQYLLVSQEKSHVWLYTRRENQWNEGRNKRAGKYNLPALPVCFTLTCRHLRTH